MFKKSSTAAFRVLPAIAAFALATTAGADEYRWQISGGYGETEISPFADVEHVMLDATYYFDPVDDARGPLALAPFLSRSSRVSAGLTNDETSVVTPILFIGPPPPPGTPTTAVAVEDTTGYVFGGRYVWSTSGWYVGGSYRDAKTDHEPGSPLQQQETTLDGYQLFAGRYFGESTSLDLGAGAASQTTELLISCFTSLCLSGSSTTEIDTDDWSIGTLHVRRGARLTYAITGRVSKAEVTPSIDTLILTLPSGAPPPPVPPGIIFAGAVAVVREPLTMIAAPFTGPLPIADDRYLYSLGGELFPTDRLGLRIGFARSDGDYSRDETYDLAATWFFKRKVAFEVALARTQYELGMLTRDIDRAEVRLLGRL